MKRVCALATALVLGVAGVRRRRRFRRRSGLRRRRRWHHPGRARRHRVGRDARAVHRSGAGAAARHRGRADRALRRGPRQPGRRRRAGRRRPRRAVRPDPGLGRSAADLLPAAAPALLPRRRQGRLPRLAGARRRDDRGALARLDERGARPHHRAGGGDRVRQGQLRPGRRGAGDGAAARQRQGRDARHPEQELRDVRGAGQVPRPADAGDARERRGAVRQHRVAEGERAVRPGPARGDPHGLAVDQGGPAVRAGRARAPRAREGPAGRAREGAGAVLQAGRRGGAVHPGLRR